MLATSAKLFEHILMFNINPSRAIQLKLFKMKSAQPQGSWMKYFERSTKFKIGQFVLIFNQFTI